MPYQKPCAGRYFRLLAVVVAAAFPLISAGHSAFSASSQAAGTLESEFKLLDKPEPLSDLPVQLADKENVVLAEDGTKLKLINFWATWCAPCVKEMPSLDELQREMGGDDFEVVTVSMDRQGMEVVAPFFEKVNLRDLKPYTDVKGDFGRAMGTNALPMSLLVKDGMVIRRIIGPADWSSPEAKAIIKTAM